MPPSSQGAAALVPLHPGAPLPTAAAEPPLVVDLDGTLLASDMLVEGFFSLLSEAPLKALGALVALRDGKAALKARIAAAAKLTLARMPWNDRLIDLIVAERVRGRRVYLASATDQRLVQAVADHLGLFDGVFASNGVVNLSGDAKAAALCAAFGEGGFDYAGNSRIDLAVWRRARHIVAVDASPSLIAEVRRYRADATVLGISRPHLRSYVQAIRLHQWLKNLLLFVPMLGAHRFDAATVSRCLIAALSFSLCASSVYVMNDLIDLDRDRAHHSKRARPFAAGRIPILHGLVMSPAMLVAAAALAVAVNVRFVGVLAIYYVTTVAYSLLLKRRMMIDVAVLAGLYGLRLLAGGAATYVPLSAWLATFSIFLFTCLAVVKRCTELASRAAAGSGDPSGRGYQIKDLPVLEGLASASGCVAVLVFELYANSADVAYLYGHPKWLSAICVILIYWVGYVMILTHRGEMKDDPVVFAATDRTSLCCGLLAAAVFFLSL